MDRRQGLWADDEALERDLGTAVAEAELCDRVESAGLQAFGIQRELQALRDDLDLLLLDLVHDSRDDEALVAVRDRSGDSPRSLVFEGDGVGVELELADDRVEGQLIPAGPGSVTLQGPDGPIADVESDEVGYFRLEVRPHGPVRLVCSSAGRGCATPWLTW